MAEDRTDRLGLPLLMAGQAQKEVTHNEALVRLDIAACAAVESADVAVPPGVPLIGQCWIVAAGASAAWSGHEGDVAGWTSGGWRFVSPVLGMEVWVADRGHAMRWGSGTWSDGAIRADGVYQNGVRVVGTQGDAIAAPAGGITVDVESRAAINAILEMLRLHGLIASTL
ncbi:hypothetical protein C1T17_15025 [Sphingobium sp. SCG-1]|uniref:DUF2793 domain-containing protein n=1 Tax=Sphingobium sp. SCG-1 TaxID=2072936 RepID=UPI000CD6A1FC|nr:DUF2793 domain-containing protein [Sphingobium sp. SCG-1]AUW59206.1 hypothetical protein C1T17_15025 [Sphingobium sp. SCG-1]